jgi:hypothetical protein
MNRDLIKYWISCQSEYVIDVNHEVALQSQSNSDNMTALNQEKTIHYNLYINKMPQPLNEFTFIQSIKSKILSIIYSWYVVHI